jgi:uncharacterized protein
MHNVAVDFLDREAELARLDALHARGEGGLVVLSGRRRVGKTRLLLEWARRTTGLYTVADQSVPAIQRHDFARALASRFAGFADVHYPTWQALLTRLAQESSRVAWRGPIVIDELPYLVEQSPELPSVLQRWVDHDARAARLTVALAGSSQRMMQGLVLAANAPLFGRASENIRLPPLPPRVLRSLGVVDPISATEFFAAWGGIPRYWELAEPLGRDTRANVVTLVLDPQGPLHAEPTRLLMEEQPPATELKPLLDAIGAGAHRLSEIAARMGRPATSLGRALERLRELGLVRREIPFGEPELRSKRSLYVIDDPFLRLWFRVVAGNRAALTAGTQRTRAGVLSRHWDALVATCWEELARAVVPGLPSRHPLSALGPWGPAGRWWHGNAPEWDIVATDESGGRLLLGEAKWSTKPFDRTELARLARALASRPLPTLRDRPAQLERVLVVPRVEARTPDKIEGVWIVTGREAFA